MSGEDVSIDPLTNRPHGAPWRLSDQDVVVRHAVLGQRAAVALDRLRDEGAIDEAEAVAILRALAGRPE